MFHTMPLWPRMICSFLVAMAVSYFMTPHVKTFAERVGAIDVPKEGRRIHKRPIPRMGGLAIFMGFLLSVIIFASFSLQVLGMLLGALIIAAMGAVDDIISLKPIIKLGVQLLAAFVALRCSIYFNVITNPYVLSYNDTVSVGLLTFPLTVIWIVGCTNAVNLIDGLDGLAVGVSAISSFTLLAISLLVSEPNVNFILAALLGACIGFMPYNMNPAKIFMGDVGSQFLGYVLSVVSIMGFFKMQTVMTVLVPVVAMMLPLADTAFAFARRILHGQSPFRADKGHFHHRLLALGLSQKQAVAVLYGFSAIMGLVSVILAGADSDPAIRIGCLVGICLVIVLVWMVIVRKYPHIRFKFLHDYESVEEAATPSQESAADGSTQSDREKA